MVFSNFKDTSVEPDQPSIQNNVFRAEVYNARRERDGHQTYAPPAYARNVHTIHTSPRQTNRACPGFRSFWPGVTLEAFSPFNCGNNTPKLLRRLCMSGVLLIRTAISILGIFYRAFGAAIGGFVMNIILTIIGFFFVAWCLKEIGNMTGSRRVFGKVVNRWHYDVFLLSNLVMHVGIIIGLFVGLPGAAGQSLWIFMWLCMFAAAWVATWDPEEPSMV